MLTGAALRETATRLAIPGRSKMSAAELRTAIESVTNPIPSPPVPQVPTVPFRARNGKHKVSGLRHSRRRSI